MTESEIILKQIRITMNLAGLACGVDERAYSACLYRLRYQFIKLIASVDRDGLALTTPEE